VSRTKALFGVGRAVGVDAKIYLNGKYQATTFDQLTLKGGGPQDPGLAGFIQRLTRSIVADVMAERPGTGPRLAALDLTKTKSG